jgi:hypothetical protein
LEEATNFNPNQDSEAFPVQSIDFPTLLTTTYVLVDDWYMENAPRLLKGKVGAKPLFSDWMCRSSSGADGYVC